MKIIELDDDLHVQRRPQRIQRRPRCTEN